jgi:ubiquinone/menaquinone biosynthesis C-methylase UbiE
MFTKSAGFYDILYYFKDYGVASRQLHALIQRHNPNAKTLLDIACGTGKHLEELQKYYRVEGLDINSEMIEIARSRCPEVPLHLGDMVDFSLGRTFDVVTCLFSSIGYVKTVENLERAVANMASHLRPGGLLFVEPWFSLETYWTGRVTANFVNEPELKIAWMYNSEVKGRLSILNIHYLVGAPQGIEYFTELHEIGLFSNEEYLQTFRKAGLSTFYDAQGLFGRGMYIGITNEPQH